MRPRPVATKGEGKFPAHAIEGEGPTAREKTPIVIRGREREITGNSSKKEKVGERMTKAAVRRNTVFAPGRTIWSKGKKARAGEAWPEKLLAGQLEWGFEHGKVLIDDSQGKEHYMQKTRAEKRTKGSMTEGGSFVAERCNAATGTPGEKEKRKKEARDLAVLRKSPRRMRRFTDMSVSFDRQEAAGGR